MSDHSYLAAVPILLAAMVYAVAAPWFRSRPRGQRRALDRVARRVRLPVPEELRPRLERQVRGYLLGADLGAAAGVAVASVWGLTLGRTFVGESSWLLILFAAALAGAALGAGLAALREAARPREDDGPRVARPVSPTLGDYLAPAELQGGRGVAVLPTILLTMLLVLGASGVGGSGVTASRFVGPTLGAGLALAALAFGELGGRRVLDAPQAAGSDLELAWSDAIRAHTLRAVVTVPLVVGTYASLGSLSAFDLGPVDPRSTLGIGLVALLVVATVALLVAVVWTATGAPHRHFRRRLWPTGEHAPVHTAPTGERW